MIKAILLIITLLFAVLGICEMIHSLRLTFLSSKKTDNNNFCVVWLNNATAIQQLQYVNEQYRWNGMRFAKYIIAVDSGLDESELQSCLEFSRQNNIIMAVPQVIENVLKEISN